ncbi:MAG: hypothetical protein E7474_00450 [Ruminococcaceae bacterium]|nr:hypothetical protein [Oscillospiraceae bacterium]
MKGLIVVLVVIISLLDAIVTNKKKAEKNRTKSAEKLAEMASPLTPGNQTRRGQKRMQMAQRELWREAKTQQDDAGQVHSIHMDSCESRLESLRVLYDAGILDREEYAQRVARVKAKHAYGADDE